MSSWPTPRPRSWTERVNRPLTEKELPAVRDCVKRGANLFAILASWPAARIDHWLALLKARAIENQAYVIGANRCGRDPSNDYSGRSQIISPRGEVLSEAGATEVVIQAKLDLPSLVDYRQTFPALADL